MSKTALQFIKKGLINQNDIDFLSELDSLRTKKYLRFIVKSDLSERQPGRVEKPHFRV